MQLEHAIKLSLDSSRFSAPEVAFHALGAHDLASRRDLETALRTLMRFEFLLLHGDYYPLAPVRPPSA